MKVYFSINKFIESMTPKTTKKKKEKPGRKFVWSAQLINKVKEMETQL